MNRETWSPQIVVVGSLNMDLVVRVPRCPAAGETLAAHAFMTNPGGKGANQAVAAARQGARVSMVGRVGNDAFGASLRAALQADGIDARHLGTHEGSSGIAMIMVDDDAQNRIAIVAGANATLAPGDVDQARATIAQARVLLLQLEVPLDAVVRAAELAHRSGCSVVLNPAPAQPLPDTLWPLLSMLVANQSEAAVLAGTTVDTLDDAARAAAILRRRGPACVIVTAGERGAVIADDRACRHVAAIAVKAVDTTAAGDTFVGALCAAWVAGESIDAAVSRGVRAAAVCVTRPGAQASIPRAGEVPDLPPAT